MSYPNDKFDLLFEQLYSIGVDTLQVVDGGAPVTVKLSDLAAEPSYPDLQDKEIPASNPALQLSGIYFMQELRRPREKDEPRPNLRAQEEELIANLRKAQFLVPMEVSPEDPKKISVPYLKNKNGDVLQPAFTDVLELERFARGKKLRAAKVAFDKLPGLLIEQAKALVINPMGFNLILDRDMLKKIGGV